MNKLALSIALVAAAAAGPVFADGAEREQPYAPTAGIVQRVDVAAGTTVIGERDAVATPAAVGGTTRAQVRAEAAEARRQGLAVIGEVQPVVTPMQAQRVRQAGLDAVGATVAGLAR